MAIKSSLLKKKMVFLVFAILLHSFHLVGQSRQLMLTFIKSILVTLLQTLNCLMKDNYRLIKNYFLLYFNIMLTNITTNNYNNIVKQIY